MTRFLIGYAAVFLFCVVLPSTAHAGILSGLGKIAAGAFQLPLGVLQGTFSGPPVVGTLFGALNGAVNTAVLVGSGAVETVFSTIPVIQAVAPYLLLGL